MRAGGDGDDAIDDYSAIDVTKDGISLATTIASATATFGSTNVTRVGLRSIVVSKLTLGGQWQSAFVAVGGDVWPTGIVATDAGGVYVSGMQSGTATYIGNSRASAGYEDAFVVKVSPSASLDWVKILGNSDHTYVVKIGSALGGGVILNFDNEGSGTVQVGSTAQQMNVLDSMVVHIPPSGDLP